MHWDHPTASVLGCGVRQLDDAADLAGRTDLLVAPAIRYAIEYDGSHSTFSSNTISVPGKRQTATSGCPTAAKPRVVDLLNLVVTSLSSIWAGLVATLCKL
jgi:hypothetical protein